MVNAQTPSKLICREVLESAQQAAIHAVGPTSLASAPKFSPEVETQSEYRDKYSKRLPVRDILSGKYYCRYSGVEIDIQPPSPLLPPWFVQKHYGKQQAKDRSLYLCKTTLRVGHCLTHHREPVSWFNLSACKRESSSPYQRPQQQRQQ
ncbi:hypothetical protein [Paraburkholderia nodosa]|uniref:hypothetical protein n=1 Tax=Paraburkholderia nodosa TaxID=392320 RepID=UPI0012B69B92|nr:hypothetical protein [Paraburkholderia nodosa]